MIKNIVIAKPVPVSQEQTNTTGKEHPIKVRYTNYRHETAVRTIIPQRFYWGKTEYHPEEQWLIDVWDCEREAIRVYALKDITEWFVK